MSVAKKIRSGLFGRLGPGLITGAADDDPSGIATYSQAGAQYGLTTLWTALITFPLMAAVQEMCARIGVVTAQGLTGILRKLPMSESAQQSMEQMMREMAVAVMPDHDSSSASEFKYDL